MAGARVYLKTGERVRIKRGAGKGKHGTVKAFLGWRKGDGARVKVELDSGHAAAEWENNLERAK